MDIVTLSCPTCGGKLQITADIERFACAHCGNEHIVKRAGGIIALAPVVESLQKVQTGVDKTASELAIQRLTREISELERYYSQLWDARLKKQNSLLSFLYTDEINGLSKKLNETMEMAKQRKAEIRKHQKIIES
jgi:transcription elongation factor Elf1